MIIPPAVPVSLGFVLTGRLGAANKFRDGSKMDERQAKRDWRWQFKTVVGRTI